ncbi:Phosphotransferase enzyme family protein [Actinopolymorpha cephalotaxi]|uniref:Phosphotransferase enzyme family protein n=1 Tax=Actinopolymorpha cephalotaxi TaxID=504797 RepID=A0A1I3CIQ2_9ACTN|nr:phosphotransferase [Actinopolymorpha cephalotaxi]NYH86746.1 Ser/Thr protein kinase RdoA (MazF antagonist) [Actinopolymorpha cephalotaxi]SFH74402.1 Phosphotransferase enzyme family protein [Actinopolymorpha cephalotaxi]
MRDILEFLGVDASLVLAIPANHGADGNANWHVWPRSGERCVLRRYHAGADADDLRYENVILTYLGARGWLVPEPLCSPVEYDGRWYGLTRFVPGRALEQETPLQQRQRGADLARLHVALRPLASHLGQRSGWRPLRHGLPVMAPVDWDAGLDELSDRFPRLAAWARAAAASVANQFVTLGAADLPLTVIHGDFMGDQNVHYDGDRLVGVIDFAVTHLGSRPYELIAARS